MKNANKVTPRDLKVGDEINIIGFKYGKETNYEFIYCSEIVIVTAIEPTKSGKRLNLFLNGNANGSAMGWNTKLQSQKLWNTEAKNVGLKA